VTLDLSFLRFQSAAQLAMATKPFHYLYPFFFQPFNISAVITLTARPAWHSS